MKKEYSPNITAWLALVVSIAALAFGAMNDAASRKHNKLSLRPLIDQGFSFQKSEMNFESGLNIMNNGTGPAIVESFEIEWFNGNQVEKLSSWNDLARKLQVDPSETSPIHWIKGSVLRPNIRYKHFAVTFNSPASIALANAINSNKLQIKMVYRSLYEEEFISKLKN